MNVVQFLLCCSCFMLFALCEETKLNSNIDVTKPNKKKELLPPCQACRMLANSFKKGIDRTARGKFEGGDASWEESRLKAYADSEIRLIEIQEKLCFDEEEKTKEQCHSLAEKHESLLEDWWFKQKISHPDVFYYLCIDKLEVCCPENHFGPDCKPCLGGIVNPCNNHGQCKGSGTRKGSGQCRCNTGYIGDFCEQCKVGYYNDSVGDSWQCLKCDKSCKAHCRKGGPKGCEVCAVGYQYSVDHGCSDWNECIELGTDPCKKGTFCVNSIGSYRCVECDKSCDGCTGDGPDMCTECAKGYTFEAPLCIENKTWRRSLYIEVTRYGTYLGLCVATLIIFRRHMLIASVIGIFVAVYIGLSEYTIGEWDKRSLIKSIKSLTIL